MCAGEAINGAGVIVQTYDIVKKAIGIRFHVILIDRDDQALIVECKQGQPTVAAINELRRHLARSKKGERRSRNRSHLSEFL